MEAAALRAVEEAVEALGSHDPALARAAMSRVTTSGLAAVFDAVVMAADELEADGEITPGTWNALADAVPPELGGLVEASRS
jgi:hypothetical protein